MVNIFIELFFKVEKPKPLQLRTHVFIPKLSKTIGFSLLKQILDECHE